jgi:hypothetical protein
MIEDMSKKTYYDDPLMTFEDSSVHGCTVDLTYAELETFCKQKSWRSLVLFQNFNKEGAFGKVGKYANSNPNFPQDWIDIDSIGENEFNNAG